MNCDNCTKTKAIPLCTSELLIGLIDSEIETVYAVMTRRSDGRKLIIEATIAEDNSASIELPQDFISDNHAYTLQLFEDTTLQTPIEVQIDTTEYDCFNLHFIQVFDEDGVLIENELIDLTPTT